MKFSLLALAACSAFTGLFLSIPTRAQGVIVPIVCDIRPCRPRPIPRPVPLPNALPVKSIQLDTKIVGQIATTHVEQVFRNDTPYTLEGTYFFPIPETASIVEFAIWENGKKLVGEVRSREEARRIYDEIVRRQRDPGLLEYAGKDLFQASIFPIPPNSDKKLEITYTQALKAESGTVSYRYPLGTGRNLWRRPPRHIEQRTSVPPQQFGTVSGKITIEGKQALRNIYSPSHSIDVNKTSERTASVSFETRDNDNDLQLFYGLSNSDFGMSLITYREPGKDGYFMLMLSPSDDVSEQEIANKDVVFVIDTSGSMADAGKMDKARAALLFGIRTLRDGDRFNVIGFAGEERPMETGLIDANAAGKKRGEEFVQSLKPTGGTNINDALRAGLRQFDTSDRTKLMVFMTDGLPTVGENNADRIIKNASEIKVAGLRLFTFGVGYDVNTRLLDMLAAENSGVADYIEPKEDIEIKVSNFFAKVNSPVLTDIDLGLGGLQTDLVYPRRAGDLFKGTQLTMIGRYKNAEDVNDLVIHLKGRAGGEARSFAFNGLDFPLRAEANDFLPRLWATRRVGWLVEQIRANGENKELRDEIVDLGTRYGIVTPYTSYLATDGSERAQFVDNFWRRRDSNAPSAKAAPGLFAIDGASAVAMSKKARELKDSVSVGEFDEKADQAGVVRRMGSKTFYLSNGVWTDSEFKEPSELAEAKFIFGSDPYFDLISKDPSLARFLSLGEEVVVVWKGKVYRVTK
ncbi:MAG: VIT domain-containing protein [Pyrinomonadaceae bacterium]